jgi:CheY-like chemotaxis protein
LTHVLIIEDDSHSLSGLLEILRSEGYNVFGAENSHDAIHIMMTRTVDIVLCDYTLPDMNGLELCPLLSQYRPDVSIFLITAIYDRFIFEKARMIGVHEIISKPIVLDDLLEKIQRYANV